jgi:YHS domain-containing protein
MKNITILIAILLSSFLVSCTNSTPADGNPEWVKNLIATYEKDPVGNPPQSIWQYEYNGQTVYFIPAQCCDQYSKLYDANGTVICAPDGGFTGQGDGKCPDFVQMRKNEKLIWNDPRTR